MGLNCKETVEGTPCYELNGCIPGVFSYYSARQCLDYGNPCICVHPYTYEVSDILTTVAELNEFFQQKYIEKEAEENKAFWRPQSDFREFKFQNEAQNGNKR